MKYKLLLASKTQRAIDDFYYEMSDEFECLTTSLKDADVAGHLKYYQPDAFVYFVTTDTKDAIMKVVDILENSELKKLRLVLIGDRDSKDLLANIKTTMMHLNLIKPMTNNEIRAKMRDFLDAKYQASGKSDKPGKKSGAVNDAMAEMQRQLAMLDKMEVPKRILVIDDDPLMLRLIKTELKDAYQVATALSGKIGLKFLENKTADLILLDYEMPEEDGTVVLEKLRANPKTKNIPVVFLTGINSREKIEKVLAMKPNGYLLKPIDHDKLVQTIKHVIG